MLHPLRWFRRPAHATFVEELLMELVEELQEMRTQILDALSDAHEQSAERNETLGEVRDEIAALNARTRELIADETVRWRLRGLPTPRNAQEASRS